LPFSDFAGGEPSVKQKNRVKLARIENDLTQAQLAEKIGVTRQTIGLIERGRYNPSLKLAHDISRALKTTLEDLFIFNDKKKSKRK